MKTRLNEGWTHGEIKDIKNKQHSCLIPYDELTKEQKIRGSVESSSVKTQ